MSGNVKELHAKRWGGVGRDVTGLARAASVHCDSDNRRLQMAAAFGGFKLGFHGGTSNALYYLMAAPVDTVSASERTRIHLTIT